MDKARFFFIILGLFLMVYIFSAVKRHRLTIEMSILWSLGALGIFVVGCFPDIIIYLADLVGIVYAPSLLFLLSIAFLLLLSLNNSMIISELRERNKELIQNNALLEERIRNLENKVNEDT